MLYKWLLGRAERYLGILAIAWYWNETLGIIKISEKQYYRIWYYRGVTVSGNYFEAKRLVIAIPLKIKSLVLAKPNQ